MKKLTYSLHMNIQTFAYSTIINITKKIYEQKKILTFLKIYLLHIYMNIYIHREHIYIHILIHEHIIIYIKKQAYI